MAKDARVVVEHLDEYITPDPAQPLALLAHGDRAIGGLVKLRRDRLVYANKVSSATAVITAWRGTHGVAGEPRHCLDSVAGHWDGRRQQSSIPMICQTGEMDEARAAEVMAESAAVLRNAGARFAYLHGSRASGRYRPDSDIDIAAYFGGQPPNAFDILLPPGVDLLVLDHAPLELTGRVAARGRLLFDDDPVSRVRWEATTRKIYFDELPRITRAHREFAASVTGRGG